MILNHLIWLLIVAARIQLQERILISLAKTSNSSKIAIANLITERMNIARILRKFWIVNSRNKVMEQTQTLWDKARVTTTNRTRNKQEIWARIRVKTLLIIQTLKPVTTIKHSQVLLRYSHHLPRISKIINIMLVEVWLTRIIILTRDNLELSYLAESIIIFWLKVHLRPIKTWAQTITTLLTISKFRVAEIRILQVIKDFNLVDLTMYAVQLTSPQICKRQNQ